MERKRISEKEWSDIKEQINEQWHEIAKLKGEIWQMKNRYEREEMG